MKRLSLAFTAMMLIGANAFTQTTIPGGNVGGTWTLAGSPYIIQGSIVIPDGATLTIEPGVTVNFQGPYKLLVLGQLLALGTVTDTITFTTPNTFDGWRSIRFDNTPATNDTSKLIYCKILFGKATGVPPDDNGGALFLRNYSRAVISGCFIRNCTASNNGGGIYCDNSSPVITNNTIEDNTADNTGGGICCYLNSAPAIINNTITWNISAANGGGAISCINSNPVIYKNTITYNTNSLTGGGGIWCNGCSPEITGNTISNNTATNGGAIHCNGSNPTLLNNTITNNEAGNGGGIFCANSNPTLTNNTLSNNNAVNGGALYCTFVSNPTFRNTILWGNTASADGQEVNIFDEGSDPNFYYCDIRGGASAFEMNSTIYTGIYQDNLNSYPLFNAPSAGSGNGHNGVAADWSLQAGSPCINAGDPSGTYPATDKGGNTRVVDGIIDQGAFEFQGLAGISPVSDHDGLTIYPNPTTDYLVVESVQKSTLEISTVDGQIITKVNSPSNKTTIDLSNFPGGVYFVKATTRDSNTIRKFIVR